MYETFEKLLKERGLRVADVCKATGLSQSMMSDWKRGKYSPKSDKLQKLADFFEVPLETFTSQKKKSIAAVFHKTGEQSEQLSKSLLFNTNEVVKEAKKIVSQPIPHRHLIPVLGRVAAGIPIEATEEIIDWEEISDRMASTGEYFALRIEGDSMEPKFSKGDIVIVRQQDYAEDGDYVIALINGNDATCKRLKKYEDGIALVSNNPAYPPMYFSCTDVDNVPIVILGKVKELRSKF